MLVIACSGSCQILPDSAERNRGGLFGVLSAALSAALSARLGAGESLERGKEEALLCCVVIAVRCALSAAML